MSEVLTCLQQDSDMISLNLTNVSITIPHVTLIKICPVASEEMLLMMMLMDGR